MANMIDLDISMAGKRSDDSVKPCPFCGSENIAYGKYEHACGTRYAILCMNCMAQIDPGWAQSWGAVQELWNRRADARQHALKTGDCPMCEDCPDGCPVETPKDSRNKEAHNV